MFVVADQDAAGIGRQSRLAGARKPEEDGCIVFFRCVHRAMHWHDAFGRQVIVEGGEDRFLGLAGIGCAADQDHALSKIHGDDGFRACSVARWVGAKARAIDDGEFRNEARQFFARRAAQHVPDEKTMPGQFVHNSDIKAMLCLGASEQVLNKIVAAFHMGQHILMEPVKGVSLHRTSCST